MTQSQLSDALGISRQTLSKWENDKTSPDVVKLMMLCEIFDSTIEDFLNNPSDSENEIIRYMRKRMMVQRKFIKLLIAILLLSLVSGGSYHYGKSRQDEKEYESKKATVPTAVSFDLHTSIRCLLLINMIEVAYKYRYAAFEMV